MVTDVANEKVFDLLTAIRKMLAQRFHVAHTTVQIERTPREQADGAHTFSVGTDKAHEPEKLDGAKDTTRAGHRH